MFKDYMYNISHFDDFPNNFFFLFQTEKNSNDDAAQDIDKK